MSTPGREIELQALLPAVYKQRDADEAARLGLDPFEGGPLVALLELVGEQAAGIRQGIGELWDDFFVETCADWVLPYIGDLVGSTPLHDVPDTGGGPGAGGLRRRADVAKTISYRRRKGTLPMLEELARDVTRWGVRAVAFFELVQWSQQLEHLRGLPAPETRLEEVRTRATGARYLRPATADIRNLDVLQRLDGAFDDLAHTVDVRPGDRNAGRHHPRRIGFFLWRLRTYRTAGFVPARPALAATGFNLSPLGNPAPLFNEPRPDIAAGARGDERSVPAPLRPLALAERPADWYGPALQIETLAGAAWQPVLSSDLVLMDLSRWAQPPAGKMGLDVALGRVHWRAAPPAGVRSRHVYAFSTDLGGGPYDRRRPLAEAGDEDRADTIRDPDALDDHLLVPSAAFGTLAAAVASVPADRRAVIELIGDDAYTESPTLAIASPEIVIQAQNRRRPVLFGDITVTGGGSDARLAIDGLTVAGTLRVEAHLRELELRHTTLVPGRRLGDDGEPLDPDRPSLTVGSAASHRVDALTLESCIAGPLRVPEQPGRLELRDSIVQSPGADGPAQSTPAAQSGNLSPFTMPTAAKPTMRVTIGDHGPQPVALGSRPTSLAQARDLLEPALRAADPSPAFAGARVHVAGNVLVVLPGAPGEILFEADGGDATTVTELRLESSAATALIGGPLPASVELTAPSPELSVVVPGAAPATIALAASSPTRAQAAAALDAALGERGRAVLHGDRLAVVATGHPGVVFSATGTDLTTVRELGLVSPRPAIAASDDTTAPGPPTSLVRCSVLGGVHVRELELVSESILAGPARAVRRQDGCVRFSSVAPGSRTPRRYRCQPDLAQEIARRERGEETLDPVVAEAIVLRLMPHFNSIRYGDPSYAQLARTCARELREGAQDGAEMGVFKRLQQPQRLANLALRLEEYMPVGLEPVLIQMT